MKSKLFQNISPKLLNALQYQNINHFNHVKAIKYNNFVKLSNKYFLFIKFKELD
jgi:hypothetical protein